MQKKHKHNKQDSKQTNTMPCSMALACKETTREREREHPRWIDRKMHSLSSQGEKRGQEWMRERVERKDAMRCVQASVKRRRATTKTHPSHPWTVDTHEERMSFAEMSKENKCTFYNEKRHGLLAVFWSSSCFWASRSRLPHSLHLMVTLFV